MQKLISDWLNRWHLHPYLWNLILAGIAIALGLFIRWILFLFIKKQTGDEVKFNLVQSLLKNLAKPLSFLIPVFLFNNFIPFLQMYEPVKRSITTGTEIALIICFAWLLIRFVKVGQDIVHYKININAADNLRQRQILTQLIYLRRVVVAIIIILTIGAVLLTFDTMRKIGAGLLTGVGIGGIIVGFAAQRSLSNLLAGFQIAFTQPIRIDDEVIVENEFGHIEELTLTYVVVRIWDNRRLVLPINYFIEKPFQNWTRTTANITGTVYIYADYRLPVDWIRNEFMLIVQSHPLWDKKSVGLVVTALKENVMELRGIASTTSSGNSFNLCCDIREQLIRRINTEFPQYLPKARVELTKDDAVENNPQQHQNV